jgi:hypothetical protein
MTDANGLDNCWMTNDDGLALQNISPAKNAGSNTGVPAADLKFDIRIQEGVVDIGAYETNAVVLPVALIAFYGSTSGSTNTLFWTTASESNSGLFEVERSDNGMQFEKIGEVNSAGNSSGVMQYQFIDNRITGQRYYYRLKQIDRDGLYRLSRTILLHGRGNNDAVLFPNPVKDKTLVILPYETINQEFLLVNSSGRLVSKFLISGRTYNISLAGKPAGLYLLINQKTGVVFKIIKTD